MNTDTVLNIGYGLGIVDRLFQERSPQHHTIIEAHPDVLAHMREQGVYDWPGVTVLEGRWQDHVEGLSGFTAVFIDTFAEGYEGERSWDSLRDLKSFFDIVPELLDGEEATFSFWNGLGATSKCMQTPLIDPTIYSVSSNLAELHMEDVGLKVEWHDVPIAESMRGEVWRGVKRRYWDLPGYRLPIARM